MPQSVVDYHNHRPSSNDVIIIIIITISSSSSSIVIIIMSPVRSPIDASALPLGWRPGRNRRRQRQVR
jgi:hypothetical protein